MRIVVSISVFASLFAAAVSPGYWLGSMMDSNEEIRRVNLRIYEESGEKPYQVVDRFGGSVIEYNLNRIEGVSVQPKTPLVLSIGSSE